ncbi:ABC transporter permease [Nonomuraea sp. K274]|uniref:ABC transporter permease n=1 Tax=Nonomuraea cypriaca TaxID=1187855 RepID=A0A931A2C7_9ACTN|nr:FtsX-like permease family protein [Nonomuraea cypriaca]MBF8184946.1 ABC transporter permease [Nonomuraea cypriaca]
MGTVLGSFVALSIAACLTASFIILLDSVGRQQPPVERYAAADMVVHPARPADKGMVTQETVRQVTALPGVAGTVPELSFPALLLRADGAPIKVEGDQRPHAWGHGWSSAVLTPFVIQQGRAPHGPEEVVLDTRLASAAGAQVGDRFRITVQSVAAAYRVSGIADSRTLVRHQSAVFFSDDRATDLAGQQGDVDALGIVPEDGLSAGKIMSALAAVPGLRVATGAGRALAEGNLTNDANLVESLRFVVALVVLIAVGVISGAMGLAIRRRAKEIAIVRAIGARPGAVRRMLFTEGLLMGLLAAVPGLSLGWLLALAIAEWFDGIFSFSAPFQVVVTLPALLWTVVLTMALAGVSALLAVRHALRIRPGDALGEAPTEGRNLGQGRLMAGLGCLVGATVLTVAWTFGWLRLGDTIDMFILVGVLGLVVTGAGMLAPWAVLFASRRIRGTVVKASSIGGFFAVSNVGFNHRRFAGTMGPLALGLTLSAAAVGSQLHADWLAATNAGRLVAAQYVIDPHYTGMRFDGGVRKALAEQEGVLDVAGLRDVYGVELAAGTRTSTAAAAIVAGNPGKVFPVDVIAGDLATLGTGSVALDRRLAGELQVESGSRVELRFPGARPASFGVVAVYEAVEGLPPLFTSDSAARPYVPVEPYQRLYAWTEPGTPTARLEAAAARVAGDPQAVEIRSHREYVAESARRSAQSNQLLTYIVGFIAVFCLIAAVNGLGVGTLDRRGEFGSMRLLGVARRQIYQVVTWEVLLTVLPIAVLATLLAGWTALLFALRTPAGLALLPEFIPWDWLATLSGAAVVAGIASTLSAAHAALKDPA